MPLTLTYSLVSDNTTNGTLGTINPTTGTVVFTPNPNYTGSAGNFTYKVNNGFFDSNVATVTVSVSDVNDPPNITSTPPSGPFGVGDSYEYQGFATDPDHDVDLLVWSSSNMPSNYSIIQPDATRGFCTVQGTVQGGSVTFDLTVTDPAGASDTQSITIGGIVPTTDSYFKFFFDSSGSMSTTQARLQRDLQGSGVTNPALDNTCLQYYLQDFFATGLTLAQGNTDNATNGVDGYNSHVDLVSDPSERPHYQLNNRSSSSTAGFSTVAGGDFPNATSVVIGIFMDECDQIGVPITSAGYNPTTSSPVSQTGLQDIQRLGSQVSTLNATNSGFYRGLVFPVTVNNQSGSMSGFAEFYNDSLSGAAGTQMAGATLNLTYYAVQQAFTPQVSQTWNDGDTCDGYYTKIVVDNLLALGYSIPTYAGPSCGGGPVTPSNFSTNLSRPVNPNLWETYADDETACVDGENDFNNGDTFPVYYLERVPGATTGSNSQGNPTIGDRLYRTEQSDGSLLSELPSGIYFNGDSIQSEGVAIDYVFGAGIANSGIYICGGIQ